MKFSRVSLAAAAAAMVGLAACQAPVPGQTNQNTQQGAMIGAGLGALVGAATGNNRDERLQHALAGAAVGGGLGAIAGNNLDRQEAELRAQLGNNVGIVNNGQQLVVTMPQDILFAVDSATLSGSLQNDLRAVATSLNNYPNTRVTVIGHTDNTGAASYNQQLSQRRAQAVSSVLINAGVPASRISSVGRGLEAPIASNLTAEGRAQNRRVEIVITPTQ